MLIDEQMPATGAGRSRNRQVAVAYTLNGVSQFVTSKFGHREFDHIVDDLSIDRASEVGVGRVSRIGPYRS